MASTSIARSCCNRQSRLTAQKHMLILTLMIVMNSCATQLKHHPQDRVSQMKSIGILLDEYRERYGTNPPCFSLKSTECHNWLQKLALMQESNHDNGEDSGIDLEPNSHLQNLTESTSAPDFCRANLNNLHDSRTVFFPCWNYCNPCPREATRSNNESEPPTRYSRGEFKTESISVIEAPESMAIDWRAFPNISLCLMLARHAATADPKGFLVLYSDGSVKRIVLSVDNARP